MTALIRIDRAWAPADGDRPGPIRFCSRCGHPAQEPPRRTGRFARQRVCERCGMGMMLSCSREALPGPGAAFAILTFDLLVSAVSEAGERIFGPEQSLMGAPLLEVLTSPMGDDLLARSVAQAAQGSIQPVVLPVRMAAGHDGHIGTLAARIATCGPPRAALVTVEPSEFGRR